MLYLEMIDNPVDRVKFEQLYLKYRGYMLQTAKKYLRNQQDAEDAVHNAFLSIAKNISKLGDIDSPKTHSYIVITLESKTIDIFRDRTKHESDELAEDKIAFIDSIPCENYLQWCILQLSPRYREVIILKYSHGYNIQEIAEILDLSFAAASKLLQRARVKLKELYEKEVAL